MMWGLVELWVDVEGVRAEGAAGAVWHAITRAPDHRAAVVRAALERARDLGCGFVVFPGWTLVADAPPRWLLDLSADTTVVAEMLLSDPTSTVEWAGFILRDGRVVVGPCVQQVIHAHDVRTGNELSHAGASLAQGLAATAPAGRRWDEPGVGEAMLVMCGEVNFVRGGGAAGCYHWSAVEAAGLTADGLGRVKCVANPAHTASPLQPLRDKRAWLSRSGLLLHTANTHGGGWKQERNGKIGDGKASHEAARAWVRGRQQELAVEVGEEFAVMTFDWSS